VRSHSFIRSLYGQVLIATAIGILVGYGFPSTGAAMKPLADGFVRLVRMIVAPIVFCTVVVGIHGVGDVKAVGKAGVLTLVYFEVLSTVALLIGLLVVNAARPGAGMNVDPTTLDSATVTPYVTAGQARAASDFLLGIIPSSAVDAFARSDILQVLLFSILFGFALNGLGAAGRPVVDLIESLSRVLFRIVGIIMWTAPLAAFGAMAATVGAFGVGTLTQLVKLVACFYLSCLLFVLVVLNAIAWAHGFSIWRFIAYIKEEIFIAFGTSSSEAVFPQIIAKLERLGVEPSVVGLVIPAGYSFNLDGSAIYMAMATVFIAQATNTPLPLTSQLALLAILMVTTKGSAGVAGAALVVLAGTISATGTIPLAGVALVVGIHRFMGEAMAATNLIGNGIATIVVGKWCGQLNIDRLDAQLRRPSVAAASEPLGGL